MQLLCSHVDAVRWERIAQILERAMVMVLPVSLARLAFLTSLGFKMAQTIKLARDR